MGIVTSGTPGTLPDLDSTKSGQRPANDTSLMIEPRLVNVAAAAGLDFQWYHESTIDLSSIPIYQSLGGGIAVLDYDRDGWPDVYFGQGGCTPPHEVSSRPNPLMRNLGGYFQEVTEESGAGDRGYACGITVGDVNQDGFDDLWVGNLGKNRLLVNNGDGTFGDATRSLGEHDDTFSTSLAIADLNGDALPDLFECNYIEMAGAFDPPKKGADGIELQTSPLEHYSQSDRWFRNLGDGHFRAEFIDSSIVEPGTSLGVVVTDFDGDHQNQVMVGNDERANHFLALGKDGRFHNFANAMGLAYGFDGVATGCMGIATGDFNRDGYLDLHVTNFLEESANLYLQNASGEFVDAATRFDIDKSSRPYVGFGSKAIDVDNDGWLDLAVTNGHIFDMSRFGRPFKMRPQFLISRGNRFEEVTVEDDSGYWNGEYLGRSMAILDYDRDGKTDLIVGHLDAPTALLQNQTTPHGDGIHFNIVGVTSERDAIGAKITLETNQGKFSQWVTAGDGYLSSDESTISFALTKDMKVLAARIEWPSGHVQSIPTPAANQYHLVIEKESQDRL